MKLISLIFIFLSFGVFAQREVIDTANFDYNLFNNFLLQQVNNLRKRKKLPPLTIDSTLQNMTKNHVNYMAKNNYAGHDQKAKSTRFLTDRLIYFGGNHNFIGENIYTVDLIGIFEKSKGRLTYYKLAKLFADNWKKKSADYKQIINPNFVGVNLQSKTKNGFLYTCQTLGSKPFLDHYNYKKGEDIYIKNKKPCLSCKHVRKKLNKDQGHMGWYSVSNDSVYYWNIKKHTSQTPKKFLFIKLKNQTNNKQLIFGKNGVVSIDLIHHEQFSCNGKTAYDRSLNHDGYFLGYISKHSLKNNLSNNKNIYQIYVGQVPAFTDTFYQIDLNYSKQWKPCNNNQIIFVNPDFFEPKEFFSIPKPDITLKNKIIVRDSLFIKVPFERNKTNEDTTVFTPLINALDSITALNYSIKSIFYTGVASIEGNEKSNNKLIRKRGFLVKTYLSKSYPNLEFNSKYYENFEDFRDGIGLIGHKDIAKLSNEQMRNWANKNRDVKDVADLLNTTRQSVVAIHFQDDIMLANPAYSFSVQHIKDLIKENNAKDAATFFQIMCHNAIDSNNTVLIDSLLALNLPQISEFKTINWNYFVFELNTTNLIVDENRLNKLYKINAIENPTKFLEYSLLFNIFNNNSAIKTDNYGEILDATKNKRKAAWLEALELISGVQNLRYQPQMAQPMITNLALKQKFNVYQTYFVCQYLISWGYTVEPYLLLSKFARHKGLFPKIYKQYIKLGYYLRQFENPREWKKIKTALKTLSTDYPNEYCDLFKWHQMGVRALENKAVAKLFCESCK